VIDPLLELVVEERGYRIDVHALSGIDAIATVTAPASAAVARVRRVLRIRVATITA
jgi:hypothetical protein